MSDHLHRIPLVLLALTAAALAQERPGLLWREDFKETPAAIPVTQEHIANPDVLLTRHGPAAGKIKKSHHDRPADDPFYVWSGDCDGSWAVSLLHRSQQSDLTGQAKIRWRAKHSGFRQLRILLKLADGKWIISDQSDDESSDWRVREFMIADLRWRTFDPVKCVDGRWAAPPDLSRVEEVGFTDLMPGGGTPASSRLDWIEVYGRGVTRGAGEPATPAPAAATKKKKS